MYNLIPPIIIIAAIGGILVIFLKKITKVSKEIDNGLYRDELLQKNQSHNSPASDIEQAVRAYGEENTNSQLTLLGKVKIKVNARARIQEMQYSLFQFLEKTLRRLKVNLMKIENAATHLTKKISERTKTFHLPHSNNTYNNEEQDSLQNIERKRQEEREELVITRVNQARQKEVEIQETNTPVREAEEEITQEQIPIETADIERLTPRKVIQEKTERTRKVKPEQEKEFVELEKEFIYRIAKNPNDIESYLALGNLYLSVSNYDDAEQSFRHALKINPNSRKAKKGLRETVERGNDEDLWG